MKMNKSYEEADCKRKNTNGIQVYKRWYILLVIK